MNANTFWEALQWESEITASIFNALEYTEMALNFILTLKTRVSIRISADRGDEAGIPCLHMQNYIS